MGSPAKRRKKNDHKASDQAVRGLDYFFAKQRETANGAELVQKPNLQPGAEQKDRTENDAPELTDEELARKLQDEWNKETYVEGTRRTRPADPYPDPENLPSTDAPEQEKPDNNTYRIDDTNPTKLFTFAPPKQITLALQSTATDEDTVCASIPLDQSPLEFDPNDYLGDLKKHWASDGGCATYALLTRCFVLVNSTQSRIRIVDTLVNLLRCIIEGDPGSLLPAVSVIALLSTGLDHIADELQVWLATNSISPPYIDLELGLGGSAISKALKKVCGLDNAGLKSLYNKYGDAGDVAFEAKKRQSFTLRKPKPFTIKSVFESLIKIANSKGHGSVEAKQRIVERLLQDARGAEESRYIVRTLVQHLRIGAVKTTMLIALSRAFILSRPPKAEFKIHDRTNLSKLKKEELAELYMRNEEIVKASFARHPNYNDLIPALLDTGVCDELLLRCGLRLHIPLRPMLGSITRDLGEMLVKLQGRDFSCEFKYDGQRAQVHCDEQGKVSIFSRHLELMTDKYPDLVSWVLKFRGEGVSSFILEGEVVAIDRESGELKTFQTLSNRARKDVIIGSVKVDVCLFAFDLMYLNGAELLDRPFRERRELLRSLFVEIPHHFTWVQSLDATSADVEVVQTFFKGALDSKCEGIMVKVLDNRANPALEADVDAAEDELVCKTSKTFASAPKKKSKATKAKQKPESKTESTFARSTTTQPPTRRKPLLSTYEPDKRLDSWLKVKKDYNTSADTLDLIPIAGFHGQGRKAKWWSPVLLAVRNADTGALEAVTKCMSGFTDKFYKEMRAKYDPDVIDPDDTLDDDFNEDEIIPSEEDGGSNTSQKRTKKGKRGNTLASQPSFVTYNGGGGIPDVWFEPQEVWEVAFADITLSPTYTAAIGLVSEDRGLSLRFPRFLRVREDKGIEEATEARELADMYIRMAGSGGGNGKADVLDEGEGEED